MIIPEIYLRLLIALGLGAAIGLERSFAHKTAGMRTYSLVCMGSSLLVILAQLVGGPADSDALMRMAAGIVTGIGFLCGGVIIFQNHKLSGLTTAAGLWVTAAVGVAVGYGFVDIATFATIATLLVLTILWFFEHLLTRGKNGTR